MFLAAGLTLGIWTQVMAQDATSRPTAVLPMRPFNSSPEEWEALLNFLDVNSPNRAQVIRSMNLPPNAPLHQNMLRQYRTYMVVKEQFPDMAELRLKQFHLEDDVFGLTQKARGMTFAAAMNQIFPQIEDKETQIVDLLIQQEQLRIDRLQKTLDDERQRLAQVEANKQQAIDNRANNALPPRMRRSGGQPTLASPTTIPDGGNVNVDDSSNPANGVKANPLMPVIPAPVTSPDQGR
jgi:hypothetical protein